MNLILWPNCGLEVKLYKPLKESPFGSNQRIDQNSIYPKEVKWAEKYICTSRKYIPAFKSMGLEAIGSTVYH